MDNAYDIGDALGRIEDELIQSMINNLKRHKAQETAEGIEWAQWQTVQLRALDEFKKRYNASLGTQIDGVASRIDSIIRTARRIGADAEEIKILKHGYKGNASFFGFNDSKVMALIRETKSVVTNSKVGILRATEDAYRRTIFNAQVYAASGATYGKAVDMAARDFLRQGISTISYKNGSVHSISEYAEMAIRTANTRACLTGQGETRQKYGLHLVIMNKRGCACPKCAVWSGKILIDDVWSGGTSEDGNYPLMSSAIASGLYHPNCKDTHSTYFPGMNEDMPTAAEQRTVNMRNKLQDKYQNAVKQQRSNQRISDGSIDDDDKRIYSTRAQEWKKKEDDMRLTYPGIDDISGLEKRLKGGK